MKTIWMALPIRMRIEGSTLGIWLTRRFIDLAARFAMNSRTAAVRMAWKMKTGLIRLVPKDGPMLDSQPMTSGSTPSAKKMANVHVRKEARPRSSSGRKVIVTRIASQAMASDRAVRTRISGWSIELSSDTATASRMDQSAGRTAFCKTSSPSRRGGSTKRRSVTVMRRLKGGVSRAPSASARMMQPSWIRMG